MANWTYGQMFSVYILVQYHLVFLSHREAKHRMSKSIGVHFVGYAKS